MPISLTRGIGVSFSGSEKSIYASHSFALNFKKLFKNLMRGINFNLCSATSKSFNFCASVVEKVLRYSLEKYLR